MKYQELTAVFTDPTTGLPATGATSAKAIIFLVDQDVDGQLSEIAQVDMYARNVIDYPGLYSAQYDTESLAPNSYVIFFRALLGGDVIIAPLQRFTLTSEDQSSKVL